MQLATGCLPSVVASMAARTVVEGQKDSEGRRWVSLVPSCCRKARLVVTTAVISQVHIRIRQGAGEPLEQLCYFSGDALLNWRAVFAKNG